MDGGVAFFGFLAVVLVFSLVWRNVKDDMEAAAICNGCAYCDAKRQQFKSDRRKADAEARVQWLIRAGRCPQCDFAMLDANKHCGKCNNTWR